jgi:low temperature requirement protein LtrA
MYTHTDIHTDTHRHTQTHTTTHTDTHTHTGTQTHTQRDTHIYIIKEIFFSANSADTGNSNPREKLNTIDLLALICSVMLL